MTTAACLVHLVGIAKVHDQARDIKNIAFCSLSYAWRSKEKFSLNFRLGAMVAPSLTQQSPELLGANSGGPQRLGLTGQQVPI